MGTAVVEARDLRKNYGDRVAVDGVSLTIAAGETYGLLGPNGAGKTTTISMICGLLGRDGGEVTVAGHDLDRDPLAAKSAIGYVPQDLALYPDLTADENLGFFGRLYGLKGAALRERVDAVLGVVGLADRRGDRVDSYSGGMKRRLNIAAGMLHRPQVLVLDEPTVGVDPQSRNAILDTVEQLGGEGLAVLYTTHYMEEAERLCDRVGIIDEGEIKAEGTRRELIAILGEHDRVSLEASGDLAAASGTLAALEGIDSATHRESGIDLILINASHRLPQILETIADSGAEVTSVDVVEPDLEAVFLKLTGKALRD